MSPPSTKDSSCTDALLELCEEASPQQYEASWCQRSGGEGGNWFGVGLYSPKLNGGYLSVASISV